MSSTALTAFSRQRICPKWTTQISIGSRKFFTLRFFDTWIFTVKRDYRGPSSTSHRWRVVHHGTDPFQIHARISKSRTALFRHFGRMLHLAPWMLHPVDIDYSDGHNFWLV